MTPAERLAAALPSVPNDSARQWQAQTAKAILAADPDLAGDIELGAAWRRVEAALRPDGFLELMLYGAEEEHRRAYARMRLDLGFAIGNEANGRGPTPAAALAALAYALEERQP